MCSCGGGGVGGVSACVVMAAVVVVAVLGEGGGWRQSALTPLLLSHEGYTDDNLKV